MSFSEAMLPLEGFAYQCEPDSSHPFKEKTKCKLVFSKSPQNRGHQLVIGDKITLPLTPDHLAVIALLKTSTMLKRTQECLFLLVRNSADDFKPYAFASEEKHESMIQLDEWRQKIQKAVFGEDRYNNKYMVANERDISFTVHSSPRFAAMIHSSRKLNEVIRSIKIYQKDKVSLLDGFKPNTFLIRPGSQNSRDDSYTCKYGSSDAQGIKQLIMQELGCMRQIVARDPSSPLPLIPKHELRQSKGYSPTSLLSCCSEPGINSNSMSTDQMLPYVNGNVSNGISSNTLPRRSQERRPVPLPRQQKHSSPSPSTSRSLTHSPSLHAHVPVDTERKKKLSAVNVTLTNQYVKRDVEEAGIDDKALKEFAKNRRETRVQKPSDRLSKFMHKYYFNVPLIEPKDEDDFTDVLPVHREIAVSPVQDPLPLNESDSSIESTLYDLSFHVPSPFPDCFELSHTEQTKLFFRFHFLEMSSVKQDEGGWQRFAELAIGLDNDELTMIDEYNARHNVPVMEIVLRHWQKLSNLKSDKVLYWPCKESIIRILWSMQKLSLLENIGWLSRAQTTDMQHVAL